MQLLLYFYSGLAILFWSDLLLGQAQKCASGSHARCMLWTWAYFWRCLGLTLGLFLLNSKLDFQPTLTLLNMLLFVPTSFTLAFGLMFTYEHLRERITTNA